MDDKDMIWSNVSKASVLDKKYFGRSESKMIVNSKKKIEKIIENKSSVTGKKRGKIIAKSAIVKKSPAKKQKMEKKGVTKKIVKEKNTKKII